MHVYVCACTCANCESQLNSPLQYLKGLLQVICDKQAEMSTKKHLKTSQDVTHTHFIANELREDRLFLSNVLIDLFVDPRAHTFINKILH